MVDFITSLDGYAAADGWPGYWGTRVPRLAGTTARPHRAYGAKTYRLMSGFATESQEDDGFAQLAQMSKVVFSSTLQAPLSWPNTRLIGGDAVEAVSAMKGDGTTPLHTLGSLSLCRALITAGLVDRFRVVVFPVITGATGRERIYDDYPDVALDLVESRTFDGRLQLLEFVPTVLSVPPDSTARANRP